MSQSIITRVKDIAVDTGKVFLEMLHAKPTYISAVLTSIVTVVGLKTIAETSLTFVALVKTGVVGAVLGGLGIPCISLIGIATIFGLGDDKKFSHWVVVGVVVMVATTALSIFAFGCAATMAGVAVRGISIAGLVTGITVPVYWIAHTIVNSDSNH